MKNDGQYLSEFLKYLSKKREKSKSVINTSQTKIPSFNKNSISYLLNLELNSLYNLAGYIIRSVSKTCKTCNKCIQSAPIPLRYSHLRNLYD